MLELNEQQRWELLARLDERVQDLIGKFDGLEKRFVVRAEFEPVRAIVYGMVGAVMLGFAGALLALIFRAG